MDYQANYQRWLASAKLSEEERKTLLGMTETEKQDAFFKDAEFGTGGMRGILGPGTNRFNRWTVGRVTIAFGLFLLKTYPNAREMGVVISHDNRFFSREFTLQSAEILNKMGIKAYIFDALRPTPELSFAVRYCGACGGIMITASHNPREYNGYKVYDHTGCQLVPDAIAPMLEILASLPNELDVEVPAYEKKAETVMLGKDVDDEYVKLVEGCQLKPELDKKGFKIIYTPQHGASYESAIRVFSEVGYEIIPVKEQCVHDPNFGATLSPNPEVEKAWVLALDYAKRYNANLVVMTDPDGDRCGLAYLSSKGTYERLTGNQSAALLIDYLFSNMIEMGKMPKDPVMYDTIVSSSLGREIAHHYGVKSESFLTGFKFIGGRIYHYEKFGHGPTFVFGYEESYGCLIQPFARDKDGVQAILLYSEMALDYYRRGIYLDQAMDNMYQRFGYYNAFMKDAYFAGMEGASKMKALMEGMHASPLKEVLGIKVEAVEDYLNQVITHSDGRVEKIEGLPVSDVLKFIFEDKSSICIRPSGTEPKMKFYVEVVGKDADEANKKGEALYAEFAKIIGLE